MLFGIHKKSTNVYNVCPQKIRCIYSSFSLFVYFNSEAENLLLAQYSLETRTRLRFTLKLIVIKKNDLEKIRAN